MRLTNIECLIVRLSFFEERNVSSAIVFGRWEGVGACESF